MSFIDAARLAFPEEIWFLLVASLILCAVGFYKYVYFLSIGYGFAIAGEGIVLLIQYRNNITYETALFAILFLCYGARLSGFLLYRERKSISYRKTLKEVSKTEKPMSIIVKILIWISVSILYVAQISPLFYRLSNGAKTGKTIAYFSIIIMMLGLLIESLADYQKTKQKKANPHMVAMKGLYKKVRCPNYFGEIVFWTGVFLSGCPIYQGCVQWIVASFGYLCIVMIMISGAMRLETRQNEHYCKNAEYQNYVNSTPILIPFIPIYHLVKNTKLS